MNGKRARSVYCSLEEREAIARGAGAAGKSISRFLLDPALDREDGDDDAGVLTEEERAELRDGIRGLAALLEAVREVHGGGAEAEGTQG